MEIKRFMELLDNYYFRSLKRKTSWGRNEVIDAYINAKADAAVQLLQEEQERLQKKEAQEK